MIRSASSDRRFQKYRSGFSVERQNPEQAIEIWSSLDRTRLRFGYVVDIALAVSYQTAFARTGGSGRTDVLARLVNSGLHHFSAALRGNPLNSSVYKDLGDFYFTQFRPVEAWLLWDFARNIDDKFGSRNNSDLVDQLESGLESNFPDYFR